MLQDFLRKPVKNKKQSDPETSRNKKHWMVQSKPCDAEIFESKVNPHIRENIEKYKEIQNSAQDMEHKLTLNFITHFSNFQLSDMATIKTVHMDIIQEERTVLHLQLVISYHRGLLYINARNVLPDCVNIKNGTMKNLILHM